ncbi:MAG TPA: hypothetical protein VN924_16935 [Bryobacteraceae bacterium]|nr:hypothetical protein [Bryobacteraceae bacterium]
MLAAVPTLARECVRRGVLHHERDEETGRYFVDFSERLELKEVIAGLRFPMTRKPIACQCRRRRGLRSVIVIEKHGMPGAEIRPVKRVPQREAARKLKALWDSLPQVKEDSGKFLEEDR